MNKSPTPGTALIHMAKIRKSFSGVEVLHGIDFSIYKGEVHALMGENGAGKSTLVKILMGELKMDSGTIQWEGEGVQIDGASRTHRHGLSMIHQELCLIPDMTIAENIFTGREISRFGVVNRREQNEQAARILQEIGLSVSPKTRICQLRTAQMQMVEIAKAVSFGAKVIIMDEPTSSISRKETETLFRIIRQLRAEEISFVYITHRIEEVFEIADRVTILRDGTRIATDSIKTFTKDDIIRRMVGHELKDYFPVRKVCPAREPILTARDLTRSGEFEGIEFSLYPGEILGFAGLIGAGRTEIASAMFGLTKLERGQISIRGKRVKFANPQAAMRRGLALIPEDRKIAGLNLTGSVRDNLLTVVEKKLSRHGWIVKSRRKKTAAEMIERFSIKAHSAEQSAGSLSGGNQQKVVLAKWLLNEPEILILDEPTRGIDVGSRTEIYRWIGEMAEKGKAVLLISSDMPELIGMCDRVAVFAEGRLTGILEKREITQERIMELASKTSAI